MRRRGRTQLEERDPRGGAARQTRNVAGAPGRDRRVGRVDNGRRESRTVRGGRTGMRQGRPRGGYDDDDDGRDDDDDDGDGDDDTGHGQMQVRDRWHGRLAGEGGVRRAGAPLGRVPMRLVPAGDGSDRRLQSVGAGRRKAGILRRAMGGAGQGRRRNLGAEVATLSGAERALRPAHGTMGGTVRRIRFGGEVVSR